METMDKKQSFKRKVFTVIQIGDKSDIVSRSFDIFITIVILSNIVVLFLSTFPELGRFHSLFQTIEYITVGIFIIEYLLRLWTAEFLFAHQSKVKAAFSFAVTPDGIIELLTILPFFFLSGFVVFRMLRVVRIFQLFRINASFDSFNAITSVLYKKRNQILSSLFIILVLMLASSLFMYSFEHEAQPENFRNAFSGIWWAVSTMLTIGYGDIYPITVMGKVCAIVISILGVGVVAIPTGIISAGFVEQYARLQRTPESIEPAKADALKAESGLTVLSSDLTADGDAFLFVRISLDSKWVAKTVSQVEKENDLLILMINRDGVSFRPDDETRIALDDKLTLCNQHSI